MMTLVSSSGFRALMRAVLLGLCLTGCSIVKARPAKDSGFLPHPERLAERTERAPFHGYWVSDPEAYDKIRFSSGRVYLAPVDVSYALKAYDDSIGFEVFKTDRKEEIQELARYFRERLRLQLNSTENGAVKAVDEPEPGALAVKLALVEVIPTDPGVNLIGTAAGVFVPGGGLIKLFGEGSIAMEGAVEEIRDLNSPVTPQADAEEGIFAVDMNQLWEAYKDREGQKVSPFTIKDYQKYAHIRLVLDEWSVQIAELLNTAHTVRVEGGDLVSINPL